MQYIYIGSKPITMGGFDPNRWARVFARGTVRVSAPDRRRVVITNHETTHRSPRIPPPPVFKRNNKTLSENF